MLKKEINLAFAPSVKGDLIIPQGAKGLVIIAHSSGLGHNDQHQALARHMNLKGLGTLLVDLLTQQEGYIDRLTKEFQFNLPLLTERLTEVITSVQHDQDTKDLNIGLFGLSIGSAVALTTAAAIPNAIKAIVSRSGRPELAELSLSSVYAATLFIVEQKEALLMQLNQFAYDELATTHKVLKIIPDMTDHSDEHEQIKQIENLSAEWFSNYLIAGDDDDL